MVPSGYGSYFAAAATAAAALIGLLFVAVSVRDDSVFGENAMPGGEPLAVIAFAGLVNSFVVALLGLIPDTNIGAAATVMAVLSLVTVARLQRRLHAQRRQVAVLTLTLIAYLAQLGIGIDLLTNRHDSGQVQNLAFIIFVSLVVSLSRAWSLLKGKHLGSAAAGPSADDAGHSFGHPDSGY
ncbi:MAG: hypothetical protein ACLQFR_31600 [Streptosporangiaceae bacterium]